MSVKLSSSTADVFSDVTHAVGRCLYPPGHAQGFLQCFMLQLFGADATVLAVTVYRNDMCK